MDERIPEFAVHWATHLGGSRHNLKRLQGGINNQVFRCSQDDRQWVIKGYAPVKPGQRDRMQAEVDFLQFAAHAAPGYTPALLVEDPERRCVVMEYLEGDAFPEGQPPSQGDIDEAVEFFRQLNADSSLARRFIKMDAAEGFLSLREHLNNVRQRLKRMTFTHLGSNVQHQAKTLFRKLQDKLEFTEEHTIRLIDHDIVTDEIEPDQRCISPSDFGFHNAVRTSARICFIDFEFAGLDDPAKAVEDFTLQPRVPIANSRSPLLEALPIEQYLDVSRRCEAIGPILELKWACILLAILQPARLEEIAAIIPGQNFEDLVEKRLEQASDYLSQIRWINSL